MFVCVFTTEFSRKASEECVCALSNVAIFDLKLRVSLCVCLELPAQLTQHLDIGTGPLCRSAVSAGSLSSLFL